MRTYIAIGCAYIIVGCVIAVLVFYESYCARASRSQESPELRPLLLKSIKFGGACFLVLVVFTISQILCRHYQISFAISFMISVLISLCFLGFCYLFNINHPAFSNDSTKKVKKKNEAKI